MALLTTYTVDNIDAKGYSNWYKMKVEVHLNSQSISANTSNITLKQFFATKTSSAGFYQNNNAYLKTSLSVDGGSYTERINSKIHEMPQNSANVWRAFSTWTGNVSHKSDGTLNIRVRVAFTYTGSSTSSYLPKDATGTSGNIALTTIPRASTPRLSVSSQNLGSVITIYTDRASSSFTHTATYSLGSASGTCSTGIGASYAWTLPTSLGSQMPTTTSRSGTITLKTYNGSTLLGSKSISFTAKVPDTASFRPKITNITPTMVDVGNKFDKNTINQYVQNISKVRAVFTGTAQGGATVSSRTIKIGNQSAKSGADVTSDTLTQKGSVRITATITDSRGRSTSDYVDINVLEYDLPSISSFTVKRQEDNNNIVDVVIGGKWSSLTNKNIAYITVRQKQKDGAWVTKYDIESTSGTISDNFSISGVDSTKSYDYEFKVKDSFGKEILLKRSIGTSKTAFTIGKDEGIGVGKVWERGALDIQGDIYHNGELSFFSGSSLLDMFYPVGSIYETTSSSLNTVEKVNSHFGGTWEAFGAGRVLVGYNSSETEFNTISKTGGAKTHTLSSSEMPSHTHSQNSHTHTFSGSSATTNSTGAHTHNVKWHSISASLQSTGTIFLRRSASGDSSRGTDPAALSAGAHTHTLTAKGTNSSTVATNNSTGGGGAHNNLQPYIVVYRYRRLA